MAKAALSGGETVVMPLAGLAQLFDGLRRQGYRLVGPTLREGRLAYGDMVEPADLPVGWTDLQEPGSYRLARRQDEAFFGYNLGQESWKKFLFPSVLRLMAGRREGPAWEMTARKEEAPAFAFMGVRACDLSAIEVHDRVFVKGAFVDPTYQARREAALVVAVNCTQAGGTCFCASMGTGPRVRAGFDLALTEVLAGGSHYFVVEIGSGRGAAVLKKVECRPAALAEKEAAAGLVSAAAGRMGRELDTRGLKEFLYQSFEHPHWDEVAARCLTCGNCALVCPTCFCHSISDTTDLPGETAERWRRWDTCHSVDFSYLHGGSIRVSPRSRYRQWLTHKLAAWVDQFGCLGCVGCGRCLTWCPVGIDLTQEVRSLGHAGGGAAQDSQNFPRPGG